MSDDKTLDSLVLEQKQADNVLKAGTKGKKAIVKKGRGNLKNQKRDGNNNNIQKPRRNINNNGLNRGGRQRQPVRKPIRRVFDSRDRPPPQLPPRVQRREASPELQQEGHLVQMFNLAPQIQEDELYQLLTKYGTVERLKIMRDDRGRSLEKAEVVFREYASATEAKKDLHRCELEGRTVSMEISKRAPVRKASTESQDFVERQEFRREPIQRRQGFKPQREGQWRNGFGRRNRNVW